ncbi:MAG: response regulator transcription factor [Anaerolineales bacterium]|nr:response regulator transcription factor [Anaerolineales bacterium]
MNENLSNRKILIIDDDPNLCEAVGLILAETGATVYTASGGQSGLRKLYTVRPDLVIIDVMMPDMNGWDVCKHVRLLTDTPVVMLTTLQDEESIVQGFSSGADDFISKPFSGRVLISRVAALLRRSKKQLPERKETAVYKDDYLSINLEDRRLMVDGEPIKLTSTEFRLLSYLVQNAGRVVTYSQILENVWGQNYQDSTDYVHVYLSRLRQKLEKNHRQPRYLLTEHGIGYRFSKQ